MADYFEAITKSGEKYRKQSGDFTQDDVDWVRNNAVELYYIPTDGKAARIDASKFSIQTSGVGAGSKELANIESGEKQFYTPSVPEKAAMATGRTILGAGEHLTDVALGIRQLVEPPMRKATPFLVEGAPTTEELRGEAKSFFSKKIEDLGGEDFWTAVGRFAGLTATTLAVRGGVAKQFPAATTPVKQTFMKFIAAGDKAGARNLLLKLAGKEATIDAATGLIHETARTGDIKKGLVAAPTWGIAGGAFAGIGGAAARRSATKALGDAADNTAAKKLISELWSDIVSLREISDEAYETRKLFAGTQTKIQSLLKDGEQIAAETGSQLKDPSPSLVWVTAPIRKIKTTKTGGSVSDVATEYMQAKALSAELAREQGYILPRSWDKKKVEDIINAVDVGLKNTDNKAYLAIKETERRINLHNDWKLNYLKEAGVIGENDIKRMKAARNYYFTLSRDVSDDVLQTIGGRRGSSLKRRSKAGSELELSDPIEAMTRDFSNAIAIADRNKMLASIVDDIVKNPQVAKMLSIVEKGKPDRIYSLDDMAKKTVSKYSDLKPNQFIISRNIGGGEVAKQVIQIDDPLIAKALNSSPTEMTEFKKILDVVLGTTAKAKRAGIVFTPAFFIKNTLKSTEQAFIHKPTGKAMFSHDSGVWGKLDAVLPISAPRTVWDTMRATGRILRGGVKDLGEGVPSTIDDAIRGGNIEALWLQYGGGGMVGEGRAAFAENAVRSAMAEQSYFSSIKGGKTPEEAAKIAALVRRNIGGDYAEKGQILRGTSSAGIPIEGKHIPFLNATIAGTRDVAEAIKRDPAGYALRTTQLVVVPTMVRFNALKDEEWYWALPAHLRVTRQYFTPNFWIPRSYSLPGFVGFATEEMLRMAYQINPAEIRAWAQAAQAYAISTPIPPIAETAAMLMFGKDLFTGLPIEPKYSEGELKYERATGATTEVAKKIASIQKNMGSGGVLSPAQIDALVRGLTGQVGQTAMQAGSRAIVSAEGGIMPSAKTADYPAVFPFVAESPMEKSSGYLNRFYDYGTKIDRVERSIDKAKKSGDDDRVDELRERNADLLSNKARVKALQQKIKTKQDKYLELKDTKNISYSAKEKREMMSEIMTEINEMVMMLMLDIERSE